MKTQQKSIANVIRTTIINLQNIVRQWNNNDTKLLQQLDKAIINYQQIRKNNQKSYLRNKKPSKEQIVSKYQIEQKISALDQLDELMGKYKQEKLVTDKKNKECIEEFLNSDKYQGNQSWKATYGKLLEELAQYREIDSIALETEALDRNIPQNAHLKNMIQNFFKEIEELIDQNQQLSTGIELKS